MPASTNIISFVLLFLLEFLLGSLLIHYVGCPEVKELIQILIWQRIKHPNLSSSFTNPMPVVSLGLRLTTTCARQVRLRENTQAVPQFHVGIPISLIDGPMLILKTHLMTKSPCEYNVCNKLSIDVFTWNLKDSTRFFLEVFSQLSQKWKALQWIVMTHARP